MTSKIRFDHIKFDSKIFLLLLILAILTPTHIATSSTTPSTSKNLQQYQSSMATVENDRSSSSQIQIVFSDVDGTLVHYPSKSSTKENDQDGLLFLPPSSTGMKGVISYKTLSLCLKIRRKGAKFVLVSGMRTSTLLSRLPYLPVADAYCSEGGGRIFYSIPIQNTKNDIDNEKIIIHPKDTLSPPFQLVEDMDWRKIMEKENAAGSQGYENKEEHLYNTDFSKKVLPFEQRSGLLWDFARDLVKDGWVLDTKGYATNFRVNLKQQTSDKLLTSPGFFQNLPSQVPKGINCSVNLGCIDFYPAASGKKNCCEYLVQKYLHSKVNVSDNTYKQKRFPHNWICLCDDDNDIEMAMFCHHAYIPSVTSESLKNIIDENPSHFTVACDTEMQREEVLATDYALRIILDTFQESSEK